MLGAYFYACPNCGGPIGDDRLFKRIPCAACLEEPVEARDVVEAARITREKGRLRSGSELAKAARIEEEARLVEELFEKATGSRLWSAQRTWVKRVLKEKSFAIIAPTGVGKTTFGILMAVYFASRGEKSYIVVPTTPLVMMVEEKARQLAARAGIRARILALHSKLKGRERSARMKKFLEGDFDILITTARFMISRAGEIRNVTNPVKNATGRPFRFVFVDDVDAVLKSGKSVDALLEVLGFDKEDIENAWKLLRKRRELARAVQNAINNFDELLKQERSKAKKKYIIFTANFAREARKKIYERIIKSVYDEYLELVGSVERAREKAATLVVSSATGRPRGSRVRLFSVLLGFQAGSRSEVLRNIVDAYTLAGDWGEVEEKVVWLVKRLGGGGLVYVPVDKGAEYAEKLAELLRDNGVAAEAFTSKNIGALERFRTGETEVLVGVAIYYGVAVRGLDLPDRIRYAVFAGVPRLKFSARFEDPHPMAVLRALSILSEYAPEDVAGHAEALLLRLRRIAQRLSAAALSMIAEQLRSGRAEGQAAKEFLKAVEFLRQALSEERVWKALEQARDIAIVREGDKSYILVPDTATYIQASGRTSRLVAGGLTKGLSVVVGDDSRLVEGLIRRTRWYADAEWKRLEELDLDEVLREIDRDRERVRAVLEGRIKPGEVKDLVKTALLIVESPNKARTIAGFFGKPSSRDIGPLRVYEVSTGDYVLLVAASGGHVYDLAKPSNPEERLGKKLLDLLEGRIDGVSWRGPREVHGVVVFEEGPTRYLPVYTPIARCMVCGYQWTIDPTRYTIDGLRSVECPFCGSKYVRVSWTAIEALRDLASEVDVVLIGTDPDTEGEKIGWDTAALIAPFAPKLYRVEFHEVTRKAILQALHEVRSFEENLVRAQIVRRIEDRWLGFSLSRILWHWFWRRYCEYRYDKRIEAEKKRLKKNNEEKERVKARIQRWNTNTVMNNAEEIVKKANSLNAKENSILERIEELEAAKAEMCRQPNYNLSAGRVQTPVLGWIVENTLEHRYEKLPYYTLRLVGPGGSELVVELSLTEYDESVKALLERASRVIAGIKEFCATARPSGAEWLERVERVEAELKKIASQLRGRAEELVEAVEEGRVEARVEVVSVEEVEVKPPPPFTTDAMLAEATTALRLGAPEVMRLAQDLFEMGFITYHRTDSTRVSDAGIAVAREYLRERYGEERLGEVFVPRKWGEGGAHEAIRPTRPIDADRLDRLVREGVIQTVRPLTRRHIELYRLIFNRFIASQMKPARLVKQVVRVVLRVGDRVVEKVLERYIGVVEKGFLEVYETIRVEGGRVEPGLYRLSEDFHPRRALRILSTVRPISQADAVRLMKERGIGRPSTYAKIIDTLLRRAYVALGKKRSQYLFATERGKAVYSFLTCYFEDLVSEETTRELQEVMDSIERGEKDYQRVLDSILSEIRTAIARYPELRGELELL